MDAKNITILGMGLLIIIMSFFVGCPSEKPVKPLIKIKKEVVKEIQYVEGEVKVVKQIDTQYKVVYKTKYDTIYAQAPDTCHQYLNRFKAVADSALKIKDLVIIKQDSLVLKYKTLAKTDSLLLKDCTADNKRLKRKLIGSRIVTTSLFLLTFIGFTF